MERESNPMQALCRSGCGFYGSPATDGLCSLCYKEALKKKQQLPNATSLSALRDTTTAQTTISSHLSTAPVTSDLPTDAVAVEECSSQTTTASPTATSQQSPDVEVVALASSVNTTTASGATVAIAATITDQDTGNDDKDSDKDPKKKKNRCATCRKKVGLTGFQCRCGGLYCAIHRYSDKHDCSFNYREMGAQEIRRNNPVVVGEKIQKI